VAAAAVAGSLAGLPGWQGWFASGYNRHRPSLAVVARLSELAVRAGYGLVGEPLATPTSTDGLIDPDAFGHRLAARIAGGEPPGAHDLAQALLRLPAGTHPELADRVRRLDFAASSAVARWLDRGGVPTPAIDLVDVPRRRAGRPSWEYDPADSLRPGLLVARLRPAVDATGGVETLLPRAFAALFRVDHPLAVGGGYELTSTLWPSVMPTHREVIAAHALTGLARQVTGGRGAAVVLPLLAESHGEAGVATRLALAYGLSAFDVDDRAAAVDALVILAARRQLDGAALGAVLGDLLRRDAIVATRVVPGLRDLGRAGAWPDLWDVVAATLEATLPVDGRRPVNRLGDLAALAVEAAEIVRPARPLPGLDVVAGRSGSSRLVTEARRLQRLLGGPSGR
jgi:hypothetical protein